MDESPRNHKRRRLAGWDYSRNGFYFVTFCTYERAPYLGSIRNIEDGLGIHATFKPSALGAACGAAIERLANDERPFAIDSSVIMPNHVHLLVAIEGDVLARLPEKDSRTQLIPGIVSSIKSQVTSVARREFSLQKVWQVSYYDHIVRNEDELERIREYIANNPQKWACDRFYSH